MSRHTPLLRKLAPLLRQLTFAAGFLAALGAFAAPALAQANSAFALRDTETEEMLRSYEMPLARAAGLDLNSVHVYVAPDTEVNAFATYPEDIFICAGILLWLKSPNELIGVMAHETGHISAGHLSRFSSGVRAAMIPMLLSLVIGIGAMIAGAGDAGMAVMGVGQAMTMAQLAAFTRVQESTADQIAAKLLLATHQSPLGLYHTFQRFADEEARGAYKLDKYAVDHPAGQDRVFDLNDKVEASPYREVQDSPQSLHTFQMVQAKLAGFIMPVNEALNLYPASNTSEPARYARAMIYLRQPNLKNAMDEINSLIQDEPANPYFYEVRGQIYMSMAKPMQAIPDYQKAVALRPNASQLRLALGTAQLALEDTAMAAPALANLKAALLVDSDDPFTWYETAHAYNLLKNDPMADLSTAELWYSSGDMRKAFVFASRARRHLTQGGADWERAGDIVGAAGPQAQQQRR